MGMVPNRPAVIFDGIYRHDCDVCLNRCDGQSKSGYNFEGDLSFAKETERILGEIARYSLNGCSVTVAIGKSFPDLTLCYLGKISLLEVKAQTRTFMSVQSILPETRLVPSETVALNKSDLEKYFAFNETHSGADILIYWFVFNRHCITGGSVKCFVQKTSILKRIYDNDPFVSRTANGITKLKSRVFVRGKTQSDITAEGEHKGVIVNYHFSLNELTEKPIPPIYLDELIKALKSRVEYATLKQGAANK